MVEITDIAYMIMNIDNARLDHMNELRSHINEVTELYNKCVFYDCRRDDDLRAAVDRFKNIDIHWNMRRGHFGVWASTISAWEYIAKSSWDGVIVFESDATVHPHFDFLMKKYLPQLPEDWDVFSIHNPINQDGDYYFGYNYDENGTANGHQHYPTGSPYCNIDQPDLCRLFTGYGGCALMYSPKGAQKYLNHLAVKGIWSSSDCQILQNTKGTFPEPINGYCVKPMRTKPAGVILEAETQIHTTSDIDIISMIMEERGRT